MYTTFSASLDQLFGGYLCSRIHVFFGEPATGKTHLTTYQPILSITKRIVNKEVEKDKRRFIVVCCDGSFSIDRLKQIIEAQGVEWDWIKDKLIYEETYHFVGQHDLITKRIPSMIETSGIQPLLIAVDGITALYKELADKEERKRRLIRYQELAGMIEAQLRTLLQLSMKYGCVVTVSTWPRSKAMVEPEEWWKRPFLGGKGLAYFPTVVVYLEVLSQSPKVVRARLWKHRFKPESQECMFQITEKGVEDVEQER